VATRIDQTKVKIIRSGAQAAKGGIEVGRLPLVIADALD